MRWRFLLNANSTPVIGPLGPDETRGRRLTDYSYPRAFAACDKLLDDRGATATAGYGSAHAEV